MYDTQRLINCLRNIPVSHYVRSSARSSWSSFRSRGLHTSNPKKASQIRNSQVVKWKSIMMPSYPHPRGPSLYTMITSSPRTCRVSSFLGPDFVKLLRFLIPIIRPTTPAPPPALTLNLPQRAPTIRAPLLAPGVLSASEPAQQQPTDGP